MDNITLINSNLGTKINVYPPINWRDYCGCIAHLSNPPLTQPLRPAAAATLRSDPACRAAEEREGEERRGPAAAAALPPEGPARNPRQPASHRWPQERARRPPAAAMPTRPRRAVARAMVPSARRMPSAQRRRPSRLGAGGGGAGKPCARDGENEPPVITN